MKKTLILGSVHVELINHVEGKVQANEAIEKSDSLHVVSGGGYQAATLFHKIDFPYFLGSYVASGEYGDEALKKVNEIGFTYERNEGIAGCRYLVIGDNNESAAFTVPGAEYEFNLDAIELLNHEEYSGTILFSEMLVNDDALVVLAVLASMQKPIYFVVDERIMEVDPDILGALFELKPIIFIDEKDAKSLYAGEVMEIDRILDDINYDVDNDVYLLHHSDGIYYYDGKERTILPLDNAANITRIAIGFVLARNANIDKRNALLFGKEVGELSLSDIEGDISDLKDRLIRMISYK